MIPNFSLQLYINDKLSVHVKQLLLEMTFLLVSDKTVEPLIKPTPHNIAKVFTPR